MERVFVAVGRFVRSADGQNLLEYGMLAALIAIAAMIAVTQVGSAINTIFWQTIAAQSF